MYLKNKLKRVLALGVLVYWGWQTVAFAYTSPYKIMLPPSASGGWTSDFKSRAEAIRINSVPIYSDWYLESYPDGSYGPLNPQLYSSASSVSPDLTQALAGYDRAGPVFNVPSNTAPPGIDQGLWQQTRLMAAAVSLIGTAYEHLHLPWFNPAKAGYTPTPASTNSTLQTSTQLANNQSGTTPNPYYAAYLKPQPGIDCTDFAAFIYNMALGIQMYSGTGMQIQFTSGSAPAPGNSPVATVLDNTGAPIHPTFYKSPNYGSMTLNAPGSLDETIKQFQPGDLLYIWGAGGNISHVVMWLGSYGKNTNGQPSTVPLVISSHDNTPAIFDTTTLNPGTGLPSDGNIAGHLPPPGVEILPFTPDTWFYQNFSVAMRVIPKQTNAARLNLYDTYSESYIVPYASPVGFGQGGLTQSLTMNIQVGGTNQTMEIDTGSRGIVLSKDQLPADFPIRGRNGSMFYWSSGWRIAGKWINTTVTFPDALDERTNMPVPVRATVPILVANSVTCVAAPKGKTYPNHCDSPGVTNSNPKNIRMMGVGFDRTGHGDTPNNNRWNQQYNPFLNLDSMRSGRMRAGYILTPQGVKLGLTAENTGSNYAYQKLIPTGLKQVRHSPSDWQAPLGSVTLNGISFAVGQAVLDTGINDMLLSLPGQPASGVLTSGTLGLSLLNSNGRVGYTFNVGDIQNPVTPNSVTWSPLQPGRWSENRKTRTFLNTGMHGLNAFDFLYDGTGGYIGLKLNGYAPDSVAYLSPMVAASDVVWPLPENFQSNLPITLQGRTIVTLSGDATLNAPVTGNGDLVIKGKGKLILGCNASFTGSTTVWRGSILVYSALQGQIKTRPGGKILQQVSESGTNCRALH